MASLRYSLQHSSHEAAIIREMGLKPKCGAPEIRSMFEWLALQPMRPVTQDGHVLRTHQSRAQDEEQINAVAVKPRGAIIPTHRTFQGIEKLIPTAKENVKQTPKKRQIGYQQDDDDFQTTLLVCGLTSCAHDDALK